MIFRHDHATDDRIVVRREGSATAPVDQAEASRVACLAGTTACPTAAGMAGRHRDRAAKLALVSPRRVPRAGCDFAAFQRVPVTAP